MLLCMFPGGVWSVPFVSPKFQKTIPYAYRECLFSSNSVLLGVLNAFLRCTPWCWMVCPPSRGSCLPLSSIVPLLVSLCWRLGLKTRAFLDALPIGTACFCAFLPRTSVFRGVGVGVGWGGVGLITFLGI